MRLGSNSCALANYLRGVTPIRGASCVAMGLRLSLSGSTFGLLSHGCGVCGSAYTIRLEYNPNPNARVPAPPTFVKAIAGDGEFHFMWQRPRRRSTNRQA